MAGQRRDLWVDFNDLDRDGNTSSLQQFAKPRHRVFDVGEVLVVGDDEGNRAEAVVTYVEGEIIHVRITNEVVNRTRNEGVL